MCTELHILGVDIGSVSIAVVEISRKRELLKSAYEFHHGLVVEQLKKVLGEFDLQMIRGIAATTSTPSVLKAYRRYDNRIAVMAAARELHPGIGSILMVGGEKFGVICFDKKGAYRSYRTNTSCACGTGSFLDQQARRLNLKSAAELSEHALCNRGALPKIASRCAVFAKTDLVHAQQEGYTLDQICDGLCHGLAKNIVDTLSLDERVRAPIFFTGGVSRNNAVVRHLASLTGKQCITDASGVGGALGAAFLLADELRPEEQHRIETIGDLLLPFSVEKRHYNDPLELTRSQYPLMQGSEHYEFTGSGDGALYPVEVDIYEHPASAGGGGTYLGIDIGSTSTKAVLMGGEGVVFVGVYTRTAGKPVAALQRILAALAEALARSPTEVRIQGIATTGSGRKLGGKIMSADLVLDEITAHARAAYALNPDTDTIIEIGGQDSKFTTLQHGMVTFSLMNNVCAAGTGSFIEEQAQNLGCPLSELPARTMHKKAPIVSDRCTVFMERDLNHYLGEQYAVDEVLASVLHAIRENYLTKVAIEERIGSTVAFQGATAKNKALVAAFEQRLQRPIFVSKFCHLTGALGAALILSDQKVARSHCEGIELHKKKITVRSEVCDFCTNHCKLTVADREGEKIAYGFLCGRDYETKKFVNKNISGFDLLRERKKVCSFAPSENRRGDISVGIPAALHLFDDLGLWEKFFDELGIRTITSEGYGEALSQGKYIAGAEFCAPVAALYGHVKYLADKADFVFLPFYLERKAGEKGGRRQYCYYTQFAPALASIRGDGRVRARMLTPLIYYLYSAMHTKVELYRMLRATDKARVNALEVHNAYDKANEFKEACRQRLRELFEKESRRNDDVQVVLLGRPYTILSPHMNKGIPDIFAALGIKVYFQDMLPDAGNTAGPIEALLQEIHWHYAAEILKVSQVVAETDGLYPVLITSFKCSPDSFIIDYFKKIMEAHQKPYLILQLDEHASSVGYETRIEAAIRSFRNHRCVGIQKKPVTYDPALVFVQDKHLLKKTLVIPNWDSISISFMAANLNREGIDARVLEETETSIQKGLRRNSGQCIPLNMIAQEFVDYLEKHELDPAQVVLWMPWSKIACNIGLYPHRMHYLLQAMGKGMEKAGVYAGPMSFIDISMRLPVNTYFAYLFGGFLRKVGCRIRPYEKEQGTTDRVLQKSIDVLTNAFRGERGKEEALARVISDFEKVEVTNGCRPKVAIFGDVYVRDNDIMNQDLIHFIEAHQGEVVVTPYSTFMQMIVDVYLKKWFHEGEYLDALSSKALITTVTHLEKVYLKYFGRILGDQALHCPEDPEKILSEYHLRIEHTGESMDNILKIFYIKKQYPDIALFVQTSPAFCCPSLVTEAMAREIEQKTGVPVLSITYDGTAGFKNDAVIPYLTYLGRH